GVQPVVVAQLGLERGQRLAPRLVLGLRAQRGLERLLRALENAAQLDDAEVRLALLRRGAFDQRGQLAIRVLLERQLGAQLLRLGEPRADRLDPRLGRGELALALRPRLRRRLEPARAALQLAQLAQPRLRPLVPLAVVLRGQRGQLGAQLLEPLLALLAVRAQRVELLHRLLAAREPARLLLDGGAHGRAARLRLGQVVRLAGELLLALPQPLAVLHQRLPLVAQPREHALELHAQRPLAGRAGPLGPRLLEHPHLLLQLLPPLAVRLEPRPHLFLLLH